MTEQNQDYGAWRQLAEAALAEDERLGVQPGGMRRWDDERASRAARREPELARAVIHLTEPMGTRETIRKLIDAAIMWRETTAHDNAASINLIEAINAYLGG